MARALTDFPNPWRELGFCTHCTLRWANLLLIFSVPTDCAYSSILAVVTQVAEAINPTLGRGVRYGLEGTGKAFRRANQFLVRVGRARATWAPIAAIEACDTRTVQDIPTSRRCCGTKRTVVAHRLIDGTKGSAIFAVATLTAWAGSFHGFVCTPISRYTRFGAASVSCVA